MGEALAHVLHADRHRRSIPPVWTYYRYTAIYPVFQIRDDANRLDYPVPNLLISGFLLSMLTYKQFQLQLSLELFFPPISSRSVQRSCNMHGAR